MGTTPNPGFMGAYQHVAQKRAEDFQRNQEQQIAQRNQQIELQKNVLNNPHLDPNDPALNDIKDPLMKEAEVKRRVAKRQEATDAIAAQFAPHEGASLVRVLSGLIHGAPAPQNPAATVAATPPPPPPDPNAPPPAPVVKDLLGIPISDPAVAAAHQEPMRPMQTDHPIPIRIREALDALGNHLHAAGQGFHAKPQTFDTSNVAANYASPTTTARETSDIAAQHAEEAIKARGEQAIDLEKERRLRFQEALPEEKQVLVKYAADNGYANALQIPTDKREQVLAHFHETTKPKLTTALVSDPDSSTGFSKISWNQFTGEVLSSVPGMTPPRGYIPTHRITRTTDPATGLTTQSVSDLTPQVPGGNAPAVGPNAAPRPVSKNAPTLPDTSGVAASPVSATAAPPAGNGAMRRGAAIKASPTSAAPAVQPTSSKAPTSMLTPDGQIPEGVAPTPQVREAAQDILDDKDVDKLSPKLKYVAEQVARKYGWSQGAFTPREQKAVNLASDFLEKLNKSDSLKVFDSPVLRAQAIALFHQTHSLPVQEAQGVLAAFQDPAVSTLVRLLNANQNNITASSSIIRPGKPTEGLIKRLGVELPNLLQSKDATDAKERIKLMQDAIKDSQKSSRLKGLPDVPESSAAAASGGAEEEYVRDAKGKLVPKVAK